MLALALLFLAVLVINVLPAFAPPTWMVLAFYGFNFPPAQLWQAWQIGLVAALAATAGRWLLASFAQRVTHSRWVNAAMRDNLDAVAEALERRRAASALAFLMFALSPLPSNLLFLAYGMTRAPLAWLALPFFCGRFVSYSLALAGGAYAASQLPHELSGWTGAYFLLTQLLLLALVYAFAKLDWRRVLRSQWLRWLR